MQQMIIGLVLGVAVGVGVGYALFQKKAEEPAKVAKDRGAWPDVACPPGQTQFMVNQRLYEILMKGPPPNVMMAAVNCLQEEFPPEPDESWMARSNDVFNAWNFANAMPPDWVACAKELEPKR